MGSGAKLCDLLTFIVEKIASHDVLRASACSIYLIDPSGRRATQQAGTGYQRAFVGKATFPILNASEVSAHPRPQDKIGITAWILSTGKPFLAETPEDLRAHPHHTGKHDVDQLQGQEFRVGTLLGVPIRDLRGEVAGLIKAERCKPCTPFSLSDEVLLETAARIASKCLVKTKMVEDSSTDQATFAWAAEVVDEAAASEPELDTFLDAVVQVSARAMGADSCGIYLIDKSKKTLTQRAGVGSQEPRFVIRSYQLPSQRQLRSTEKKVGLTAWIAATGSAYHASNSRQLHKHHHHRGVYDRWNFPKAEKTKCGAFYGVPLRVGTKVIGVLKVENICPRTKPDPRDFSSERRRHFDLLAQEVALAIQSLQDPLRSPYRVILEAQPTISQILRGGLDLRDLVKCVVTQTAKLLNARACALFLRDGNKLIQPRWAAVGWAAKGPAVREYDLVPPDQIKDHPSKNQKVGLTVWIAVKREPFAAKSNLELQMHPHHKGTFDKLNFEPGQRCESFMGTPLVVGDELVGVLKVETKMKQGAHEEFTYFTEQDTLVFNIIASSAANAIHYIQFEKSRKQRELEAAASMYRLTLLAFAHRGRGELSLTKKMLEEEGTMIAKLPYRHAQLSPEERRRLYRLITDTETSIDVLNDLYSQYEKWFGEGDKRTFFRLGEAVLWAIEDLKKDRRDGRPRIPVKLNIPDDLPPIWGRRSIIQYVIHELLRNARRHAKSRITVQATKESPNSLRLVIANDGPGITPDLRNAFEEGMLMRKENVTEGGLGLLLSKQFVKGEHGELSISASNGISLRGACFAVVLPTKDMQHSKESEA